MLKKLLLITSLLFWIFSGTGVIASGDYTEILKNRARPIKAPADIEKIAARVPEARLILLGEATHGTSEFYSKRAEITKALIKKGGISFVAVEGDWAPIHRLNRYVIAGEGGDGSAASIMAGFDRWPQWMWANQEVEEFIEWLKGHNSKLPSEKRTGFYGLDVYGQWEAMDRLLEYLKINAGESYEELKRKAKCFTTFGRDGWRYARAAAAGRISCQEGLNDITVFLENNREVLSTRDHQDYFQALQNAYVLKNAEEYYRLAVRGGADSWNSRVYHMNDTVNRLLDLYGSLSRGVIWAHNTHVGDARATRMADQGLINIGKLGRKEHGRDNVFIIGFSTYTGKVMAGSSWGSPAIEMQVPQGASGSLEDKLNKTGTEKFYLVFDEKDRSCNVLMKPVGHRAIGVVYNPHNEFGNYVPTILPERYDMMIFIRETTAVIPVDS